MKYLIILLGVSLCAYSATAQPDTLRPQSAIKAVSVFFKGAQVSRQAQLSLKQGKYIVILSNLPAEIDPSSIQVASITGCTTLSVKHKTQSTESPRHDTKQRTLNAALESRKHKINQILAEISVLQMEEKLLLDNSDIAGNNQNYAVGKIAEMSDFYRKRIGEIRLRILELNNSIVAEKELMADDLSRLNQHVSQRMLRYSEVLIAIESQKPVTAVIDLSYYVQSAGWSPTYDFRVADVDKPLKLVYNAQVFQTTGEDWEKVNLTLSNGNPAQGGNKPTLDPFILGSRSTEVQTSNYPERNLGSGSITGTIKDAETGEALPFVNVLLTQGDRTVTGVATDFDGKYTFRPVASGSYVLSLSYVGYNSVREGVVVNPDKITFKNIAMTPGIKLSAFEIVEYKVPLIDRDGGASGSVISGRSSSETSDFYYIDGIKVRGSRSLPKSAIESVLIDHHVVKNVGHIEYAIDIPYTIRSDGQDYSIQIKETLVPADYIYHVVPKLESDAFLTANIINQADLNLLSGDASIYYGGTFTGRTYVNAEQTDDTLSLSLGRDKALVVQRSLNRMLNERRTQGSNTKETIAYDLVLRNNKSHKIKVVLEDQYPISQLKSVQTNLLSTSGAVVDEKTGNLTWEFSLEPNSRKEIAFSYEVKYPSEYAYMMK
jgi:hypothetical protein